MNLLLDTHVLLWWLADDGTLSVDAQEGIANPVSTVFVSVASIWEIAIKQSLGRLDVAGDLQQEIANTRFEAISIAVSHALFAGTLPRLHGDPFDRMLVAQAMIENLTIVTRDPRISSYGVPVLKA